MKKIKALYDMADELEMSSWEVYIAPIISAIFCIIWYTSVGDTAETGGSPFWLQWYFTMLFFWATLLSLALSVFSTVGFNLSKDIKACTLIVIFFILGILVLPFIIAFTTLGKLKMLSMLKHPMLYMACLLISLFTGAIVFGTAINGLAPYGGIGLNLFPVAFLAVFFSIGVFCRIFLWFVNKILQKLLPYDDYCEMLKDMSVMTFAIIAVITLLVNCIKGHSELVAGVTGALAIYIAFDRVQSKWKSLNKNTEK